MKNLLTEKALIAFENFIDSHREIWVNLADKFNDLPKSMQQALIIEWFDSIEIIIEIAYGSISESWIAKVNGKCVETFLPTRSQATTEAIKKANSIFNTK